MGFGVKDEIKKTPLGSAYIFLKRLFVKPTSQADEAQIIGKLCRRFEIPRSFIEFGFSGWEFNCALLIDEWDGLLVDGDRYNVKIGEIVCPKRIVVRHAWLTLDSLDFILEFAKDRELGILSIDVDGNDYWFLEKLIVARPAMIIAEYNSSFGLRPVTVPYDREFDRTVKHESRTYYGASLAAISILADRNGYGLLELSNSGVNAFFIRRDLLTIDDHEMKPEFAFREKCFADGSRPSQQWERIRHLPFVNVANRQEPGQFEQYPALDTKN